jgi:large subunit ribosomal protein L18
MAHGPTYRVKFRRRREGRTDYYRRRRLLMSRLPRLVVRKTNTSMIVQLVNAEIVGDRTVASAVSRELPTYGWSASTGNLPAAYLTGLLAGRRAKERGVETAVLDLGLNPPIKGSRVYAALKGALDAGLEVAHDPDILPDESRLKGDHVVEAYKHFKEDPGTAHMFTQLEQKKADVGTISKQFGVVKKRLLDIPAADLKMKKKAAAPRTAAAAAKKPVKKPAKKGAKAKAIEKAPRAVPIKPRPRRLVSKGKGRAKGKKGKSGKS